MADQMFFDARDLFHNTIEHDSVNGAEQTMIHAGFWRSRFDLVANAAISPVKHVGAPNAPVRIKMRANATVVPA